jgi:fused signal recognition particle receptor
MDASFLDQLRGDLPELSPLQRFSRASAIGDVLEDRQAEARRAERADEREGMLMAEAAAERQQLATRGWTDRELAVRQAQMEAERADRIAELEAELDRLDPQRRAARRADAQRMAAERTLERAQKVDAEGYMARAVAEFGQRRQIQRQQQTQRDIAYHEQELIRMGGY